MIKLFVLFGFMCASLFLFSQNSYVIQYDKLSNKFTYKKNFYEELIRIKFNKVFEQESPLLKITSLMK